MTNIIGFGFNLPEEVPLEKLDLSVAERVRLPKLGQIYTRIATNSSLDLSVAAVEMALASARVPFDEVGLIISAPSLITSYGLCIPAVEIRAALGLTNAQCLNIEQGCVGILKGMELADLYLSSGHAVGAVVLVTSCKASTLTIRQTHGAFFWGDGAGAVVMRGDDFAPALYRIDRYTEVSSMHNIDAMRIPFGDDTNLQEGHLSDPDQAKIGIFFAHNTDRFKYIQGERNRFREVLAALGGDELRAICLPATGRDRLQSLIDESDAFGPHIATDLRAPHIGGVDILLQAEALIRNPDIRPGDVIGLLSPAFTAQWGGIRLVRGD